MTILKQVVDVLKDFTYLIKDELTEGQIKRIDYNIAELKSDIAKIKDVTQVIKDESMEQHDLVVCTISILNASLLDIAQELEDIQETIVSAIGCTQKDLAENKIQKKTVTVTESKILESLYNLSSLLSIQLITPDEEKMLEDEVSSIAKHIAIIKELVETIKRKVSSVDQKEEKLLHQDICRHLGEIVKNVRSVHALVPQASRRYFAWFDQSGSETNF